MTPRENTTTIAEFPGDRLWALLLDALHHPVDVRSLCNELNAPGRSGTECSSDEGPELSQRFGIPPCARIITGAVVTRLDDPVAS
jgi:hypothetical protein